MHGRPYTAPPVRTQRFGSVWDDTAEGDGEGRQHSYA